MTVTPRRNPKRAVPQRNVNALLVEEAFATWLPPTVGIGLPAVATLLDALGGLSEPVASLVAVVGLLVLGVSIVLGPLLHDERRPLGIGMLAAMAVTWIALFTIPFMLRLFPGAPVAVTPLTATPANPVLAIGEGRFDLVLDAHLPPASERQTRQLHYALTLTDGAGVSQHFDGALGDRWQTRRLGRRGTAPVHLEHLSAAHEIDFPSGGTVRLDDVSITGIPNATIAATFYHRRVPGFGWLLGGGMVLALAALVFDFWCNPDCTPTSALLTATATGAAVVFCSSAGGHPGLRQLFGSALIGGIGGVPTVGIATWLARRFPGLRGIASGRAA